MAYVVQVDFGLGWENISAYLDGRFPVRRTRAVHSQDDPSKPVVGTARFTISRNVTLVNRFLAASGDLKAQITKDGSAYFSGIIRPTHNVQVGNIRAEAFHVECVDAWYRLEKRCLLNATWSDYSISNPSAKASSILHQLFYAAGFSDSELSLSAIAVTVDRAVFDSSKATTYREIIEKILFETGYSAIVSPAGIVQLYDLGPTSITPSATLSSGASGNIAEGYQIQRREGKAEAVDVTFWPHLSLSGKTVFEDTTGGDATHPNCNIVLGAGSYYPNGADATHDVKGEFKLQEYDLVAFDPASPVIDWSGSGVTKQVETIEGLGCKMRFYSAGGGTISKLKIAGTAIVKGDLNKVVRELVANTEKREAIACEWLIVKANAERLAIIRAAWHSNSAYLWPFRTTLLALQPGDYVQLTESSIMGSSQVLRVVQVDDGADPRYVEIQCEGASAYTYTSLPVTINSGLPAPSYPPSIGGAPISVVSDTTPPTVPTGLSVSQISTGALRVGFNASTDAESGVALYHVYRRENGSSAESVVMDVKGGGAGPFIADDTSPIAGKYYQYAISAVDARGNESAKTAWSTATQSVISDAPANVSGLTAEITWEAITLKWTANADAIAYRVERSMDSGSTWTPWTVNTNTFVEVIASGLEPSNFANWLYRVKGISKDGVLSSSYSASVAPPTGTWTWTIAQPPLVLSVAKRTATIKITPQSNLVDPDGWDVQISIDNVNWYKPNIAAASDSDSYYTGSLNEYLTIYDSIFTMAYLPIPLSGGLPLAAGRPYYFRVFGRSKSKGQGTLFNSAGPYTAYPGLYADLAAEQIQSALLANGAAKTSKISADLQGLALNLDPMFSDISAWFSDTVGTRIPSGDSVRTIVTVSDGLAGSRALQVNDPTAWTYQVFSEALSIDPNKTYRISMVAKQVSGTGANYVGVQFLDSAGNNIVGSVSGRSGWTGLGTYFYCMYSLNVFPASFTRTEFFMGPIGSGLGEIPSNARSVRLLILPLYTAGTGVVQVQDFRIEECISTSLLMAGSVVTSKLAASAVTAAKLGVTNLDVDGTANVISMNAALVYSAATALVGSATGTKLLSGGPASGKYAYNYFDLDGGKFRVGDATNYIYYDGAGGLELRLTSFKVTSLATSVKGSLSLSDAGTLEALTKPLSLSADGSGNAYLKVNGTTRLTITETGAMTSAGPVVASNSGYAFGGGSLKHIDTRTTNFDPVLYQGISIHSKANSTDSLADGGSYHGVLNLMQWSDYSGGIGHQLAFTDGQRIYHRTATAGPTFSAWMRLIQEDSSGNVAIGTTDPFGYKLRVNGTVRIDSDLSVVGYSNLGTGLSGMYDNALTVFAVSHATSRRASITFGDWNVGQDSEGNGTKDFYIYGGSTPSIKFGISLTGDITFGGKFSTSTPGSAFTSSTAGSWSLAVSETKLIPAGFYFINASVTTATIQVYTGGAWLNLGAISTFLFSDGTNVRLLNTTPSATVNYLQF